VLADELQPADTPVGRRNDEIAQKSRVDAIADIQPVPHFLVLAGGDALEIDDQIMQPRRPGKSRIIRRIKHGFGAVQRALGMIQRQITEKLFRADPGPADEQALEMKRAGGGGIGDVVKLGLVAEICADIGSIRAKSCAFCSAVWVSTCCCAIACLRQLRQKGFACSSQASDRPITALPHTKHRIDPADIMGQIAKHTRRLYRVRRVPHPVFAVFGKEPGRGQDAFAASSG
jgi:hypothetical protein